MNINLHPLQAAIEPPQSFTYPFNYVPHPLCVMAAKSLQSYVASVDAWREEISHGKMFGVLVVRDSGGSLAYLAAYSGLLAGRNDWPYFVPPVYDSQQPDGYFKTREKEISKLNAEVRDLEEAPVYLSLKHALEELKMHAEQEIDAFKEKMRESKAEREKARNAGENLSPEQKNLMIRESQYQKAELKRLRKRWAERIAEAQVAVDEKEAQVSGMKKRRKEMSDDLQQWLFRQYDILNARGEHKNLVDIFAQTPQRVPPSGAGDCCAPKLLQYAYLNRLRPLCMAEFWWGQSPKKEIRHHLHYYPACRSKCKPILGFMMQGLRVDSDPHAHAAAEPLRILYADGSIVVVSKPSGMLSVPGLVGRESVADALRRELGDGYYVPAHRLDMYTSGLLVVARSVEMLRRLHAQFASRSVKKRYSAVLDGEAAVPRHGFVRLPLTPDDGDRPRQKVDLHCGKPSVTEYEILKQEHGKTYIKLIPHTGRTHQLRVHCAHADGLSMPIAGDNLYGHPSGERMMLHAEYISFEHPATGQKMEFQDPLV